MALGSVYHNLPLWIRTRDLSRFEWTPKAKSPLVVNGTAGSDEKLTKALTELSECDL